jgi:prevent-host-death family protein
MSYMPGRDRVGVREIRQNLSVYLERVKRGEALEITDRGQPVAIIAPLPERGSLVARLVAAGRVTPPAGTHARLVAPPPVPEGAPSISEILDDLREDRF